MQNKKDLFQSRINLTSYFILFSLTVLALFVCLDWYVSSPVRAQHIDSYILFSKAETSRLFYAKGFFINPITILNPNAKPLYALLSSIILFIFPKELLVLKVLNSLLSIVVVLILSMLCKKLKLTKSSTQSVLWLTVSFPLYFLLSIAAGPEMLMAALIVIFIYFYYNENYFIAVIFASLIPLVRQEGVLYILLCWYLLRSVGKSSYAWILPVPVMLWVLFNSIMLDHSFVFPFLVAADMPGPTPPTSVMTIAEAVKFYPLVLGHPLVIFTIIGLFRIRKNATMLPISICLIVHSLFLICAGFVQYLLIQRISFQFRYFVPIVPLMSIVAVCGINLTSKKQSAIIEEKRFKTIVAFTLIVILVMSLWFIQKNPRIRSERLSSNVEFEIEKSIDWLNNYCQENDIYNIYYSGLLTTSAYVGRLRTFINTGILLYPVKDFTDVYDPLTFKKIDGVFAETSFNGIIILFDAAEHEKFISSYGNIELIKEYPGIPMHIYRKQ